MFLNVYYTVRRLSRRILQNSCILPLRTSRRPENVISVGFRTSSVQNNLAFSLIFLCTQRFVYSLFIQLQYELSSNLYQKLVSPCNDVSIKSMLSYQSLQSLFTFIISIHLTTNYFQTHHISNGSNIFFQSLYSTTLDFIESYIPYI